MKCITSICKSTNNTNLKIKLQVVTQFLYLQNKNYNANDCFRMVAVVVVKCNS